MLVASLAGGEADRGGIRVAGGVGPALWFQRQRVMPGLDRAVRTGRSRTRQVSGAVELPPRFSGGKVQRDAARAGRYRSTVRRTFAALGR